MSKTVEWETPQEFFDKLNHEFHFRLDPCATDKNAKCKAYFTKEQDGLKLSWMLHSGSVFVNPPYGREIGEWVRKAHWENSIHKTWIVMLLPARTDTQWFHDYIYGQAEIRFLKGRLKFGGSKNSAPFPSMIVIFR
jgi:phage N-6-adenine-methyltransferase